MRRWGWLGLCLLLLPVQGEAGVPRNVPPIDDTLLRNFLKSLSDHLNTLECLTADPDGSVLGTKGELKCAVFDGADHVCMNTSTGPSKGTTWTCVDIGSTGASPTTGIFCGGTLSTVMSCETFRGRIPTACTVQRIDATVTTSPVGQNIIIDANECSSPTTCTSIWNTTQANRLTISTSAFTGSQTVFDDPNVSLGNYIGFDIDQVGSTTAGVGLTVTLVCQ